MAQNHKVAFIHPTLGIGGAEQLIVNLAVALQNTGHSVKVFTTFHDPNSCFPETKDGTLKVEVRGNFIPMLIFNKFFLLLSILRLFYLTLYVLLFGEKFDVYVVDLNSHILPLLRLFGKKTVFYLHYPDKLLCPNRQGFLKKMYRFVLDGLEEFSLLFATKIVVNSLYTGRVFRESFSVLNYLNKTTEVLYPAINFKKYEADVNHSPLADKIVPKDSPFFFSLNRYERKKNVDLAIKAFAELRKENPKTPCYLVIAGGYSADCKDNIVYYEELVELARTLGVEEEVIFLKNISHELRLGLLQNCVCVCYTPENEHFGIVPIEVMYMEKPVIAHNSGGPLESVGKDCGFLVEGNPKLWAEKMQFFLDNPDRVKEMGKKARKNVEKLFSFDGFMNQSDQIIREVLSKGKKLN